MANESDVLLMLGRIEGKLDQAITSAEQHRQDDIRRFADVYTKLGEHDTDINQAKGAKGALMWAASAIAAVVAFIATVIGKAMGWH